MKILYEKSPAEWAGPKVSGAAGLEAVENADTEVPARFNHGVLGAGGRLTHFDVAVKLRRC